MDQLSLFSAEVTPPTVVDLGGLLAGQGQAVLLADLTCRVSVVVGTQWRADRIAAEVAAAGLAVETAPSRDGGFLVRTGPSAHLVPLMAAWTKGAVKAVPEHWTPTPRELRLWALAAGADLGGQYQFGVDPHAQDVQYPLAGALSRVGLAPMVIGPRAGGPALRITGKRRLTRLADLLGPVPGGSDGQQCWPPL